MAKKHSYKKIKGIFSFFEEIKESEYYLENRSIVLDINSSIDILFKFDFIPLDKQIDNCQQLISDTQLFIKGLLQKMFV